MAAFEILFGRFVVGATWERLMSDGNVLEDGLMPFGVCGLSAAGGFVGWCDNRSLVVLYSTQETGSLAGTDPPSE
jgi:hypothetical protein